MNNDLLKLTQNELTALVKSWGYPSYRGKQIYEWIHKHQVATYDAMGNIPRVLREQLQEMFPNNELSIIDRQISQDGTRKYILQLHDDNLVETVAIPHYKNTSIDRLTVCVSSQVGCAMGCTFCATGREGFTRNLLAEEIVSQVVIAQRDINARVSNVVVMGQGEPFLNYDEVITALRELNNPQGLSIGARHITLSTCGIIQGIQKLSHEPEQFTLAVSLHEAIQSKRNILMPQVSQQPLTLLKDSLIAYIQNTGRRITFEYLLIDGFNDSSDDLNALIAFCDGLLCHINLLTVNEVAGSSLHPVSKKTLSQWQKKLTDSGIETSLRNSRGSDINGACGQLKNEFVSRETE